MSVPEGSVLGPQLFIRFINSLHSVQTVQKVISYADDTVMIFEGNSWQGKHI